MSENLDLVHSICAARAFSDFRDGLIGEDRTFLSWDAALKAVGLSE
jgi:hypothetical protein